MVWDKNDKHAGAVNANNCYRQQQVQQQQRMAGAVAVYMAMVQYACCMRYSGFIQTMPGIPHRNIGQLFL